MHYACIVGCNDEWCEQRPSLGDIGLAKCLLKCGLPKQNLLQLYDEYATRACILSSLEELLDRRNENRKDLQEEDSLLFYYGGHGEPAKFCTHTGSGERHIRHSEIINLLERKFHSGVAWIILDCCHSGSFGEAVLEHKAKMKGLNVKYGCIMSVAPDDKAGMEWTMTECFIRAFQSELSLFPSDKDVKCHYILSTSNGKHPIEKNSIHHITNSQAIASTHPNWEQVIEFLADEMARIKGDRLTNLFIGEGMEDGTLLRKPCIFGRDETQFIQHEHNEQSNIQRLPRNLTWTQNNHFHRNKFAINDEVDVKWCGPVTTAKRSSHMIGWFKARVIDFDEKGRIILSLRCTISESSWTVNLPIDSPSILSGLPFGFGFNPLDCIKAVSKMAEHLCYFDVSFPPFTKVDVLWDDDEVCEGVTATSWSEMRLCLEQLKCGNAVGPHVSIYWEAEDMFSVVSLEKCVVKESSRSLTPKDFAKLSLKSEQKKMNIKTPLEAVLASFVNSKKNLISEIPKRQEQQWEAYDAEDCRWLPVQFLCIVPELLPLEALSSHMCYQEAGDYYAVFWQTDATLSVVPKSFLRAAKREKDNADDDESNESSEDESNNSDIDKDAADVKKYIEEAARDRLNVKRDKSCCRIRLVCVNDVYSFDDIDSNDERGGWSRATTLMKELRSDVSFDTAFTIANGDVLGGSSLLQHCQGSIAIETMNNIPINLAVLGNHEFDYGDEVLKQRVNESTFDWLGSNVYYPERSKKMELGLPDGYGYFPGVHGNGVIHTTTNNINIGFFGLVTKSTPKISSPSPDVVFDGNILSVARRTASSLRKRGAQIIIAITHMSEEEDKVLAADKIAGVNLILGGHEHENLALMVHRDEGQDDVRGEQNDGGVLVFKSGMNAYWVGCVDLEVTYNGSDVTAISTTWSMNAVTKRIKEDETLSKIVNRYRKKADEDSLVTLFGREIAKTLELDDVIATINGASISLDTRMSSVRRRESTGGNLVADAMHWLIHTKIKNSVQKPTLAMINGGFIRGDRQYSPGSDFTVRHILKELPFPRTIEVLEIRGSAMIDAMRQQLHGSSNGPTGAFPHLSSNARLEYVSDDDNIVSITSFKVNGIEVSDEQTYIIGVTSFVADGNEGCKSWLESQRVKNETWNGVFVSKVLLQYLSCNRSITPLLEGRVKRIDR